MRPLTTLARWTLGAALITWRYLWTITPLHRSTEAGDRSDLPPALPDALLDARSQLAEHGVGPLLHRSFTVRIEHPARSPQELIALLSADFNRMVPSEVVGVERLSGTGDVGPGDELLLRIPGPWNGPVRLVERDRRSFRLATLRGHMEAGQVRFQAVDDGDGAMLFRVETWARAGTRLVDLLYNRVRVGREIQANMWVRACLTAARRAQGSADNGVSIHNRTLSARHLHDPARQRG